MTFSQTTVLEMADLWDQRQVRCPVSIPRVLAQEDGWKLFPDIENWSPVSVERRFSIKVEQRRDGSGTKIASQPGGDLLTEPWTLLINCT